MTQPTIDILLATHNGADFLEPLLDSLLGQTWQSVRILASDDGSADDTVAILRRYQSRSGRPLHLLDQTQPAGGAVRNFERLMQASLQDGSARWMAFCDQDDVWLPNKLDVMAQQMCLLEGNAGQHLPCLVHSDLTVVDAELNMLHPSFMRQQRFWPHQGSAQRLFSINHVTGCATLVNRALVKSALPIPDDAIMHDWWCALIATTLGRHSYVNQPLVLYRQHAHNQLGARERTLSSRLRRLASNPGAVLQRIHALGDATLDQARALQLRLQELGADDTSPTQYLAWRSGSLLQRLPDYRARYEGPELDRLSRLLFW